LMFNIKKFWSRSQFFGPANETNHGGWEVLLFILLAWEISFRGFTAVLLSTLFGWWFNYFFEWQRSYVFMVKKR
jgi:hypothetical protein